MRFLFVKIKKKKKGEIADNFEVIRSSVGRASETQGKFVETKSRMALHL